MAMRCIGMLDNGQICNTLSGSSRCPDCERKRVAQRNAGSPYAKRQWRRTAAKVKREHGRDCAICGSTYRATAHHKIDRDDLIAAGVVNPDDPKYLVVLCGRCHSQYEADRRGNKPTPLRALVEAL